MIVSIHDLRRKFRSNEALRGLSLNVAEGSAFALIGANGAGKTTTLKILMNMLAPSSGTATVLGIDSRELSPHQLAQIGYVSENQKMPGRLTVGEYIAYLRPFYPTWDRDLEAAHLAQFRLPLDRKIKDLSHGMRLKMGLLCALPFRPRLLVLDEPFSGLDALIRDEFMEGLLRQAGETTVLISSHELSEIEGVVTDIGFIDQGRLLFQESMEHLSARVREIHVTLEGDRRPSAPLPSCWLDVKKSGNVIRFVDTRFSEEELGPRVVATLGPVRNIAAEPIALRSIFTTLARAARENAA